jgi:hypothetical protein
MLCCGSDTSVEVDVKTTCKIECCSTHNGNENSTTVIDSPNESRRDSRRDSPALHPNRSLRESPVISREGSIRIDTPDILQLNRNINQSPLLKQTRLINNNI